MDTADHTRGTLQMTCDTRQNFYVTLLELTANNKGSRASWANTASTFSANANPGER